MSTSTARLKQSSAPPPPPPPLYAQQPAYSFTIPSLHDDTPLACRIYHPHSGLSLGDDGEEDENGDEGNGDGGVAGSEGRRGEGRRRPKSRRWKAAIIAHPYAPLGGSYDDPVVGKVGAELMAAGWVVGTFCFR